MTTDPGMQELKDMAIRRKATVKTKKPAKPFDFDEASAAIYKLIDPIIDQCPDEDRPRLSYILAGLAKDAK